jgi:hypothetical protein
MHAWTRLVPLVLPAMFLRAHGDAPAWWSEGSPPIIDAAALPNNHGPASIGQAKWMAWRAFEALETLGYASLAHGIRDDLSIPQPLPSDPTQTAPAILDFGVPQPLPGDWRERQHAPLTLGQLKAMATPFYDRLHKAKPQWLDQENSEPAGQGQLQLNATKDPADPGNYYPWSSATADDQNSAVATLGQLKAVFSLRFESFEPFIDDDKDGLSNDEESTVYFTNPNNPDSDADGLPDGWEVIHDLDPNNSVGSQGGHGDSDVDGLNNAQELQLGLDPGTPDNPGIPQNGILNGDFSLPGIGTGARAGAGDGWDYWTQLPAEAGWRAVTGSHIEYQTLDPIEPDNPYAELKADPTGHYGLQQQIGTCSGMTYLLAMDYKTRADTLARDNDFSILINETVLQSVRFETLGPWSHLLVPFTATKAITTLALIPDRNPDDTMGCLVDNVKLIPVAVAVDANRDSRITFDEVDQTSAETPFRFWINNDQDDVEYDEPILVDVNQRDFADYQIKTKRDLEDFCRLTVHAGLDNATLKSGEYKIGIKFKAASSSGPKIQVWENESDSGSADYLTDDAAASRQIQKSPLSNTSERVIFIPQSYWDSHEGSMAHLIFEGCQRGTDELVVTVQTKNGTEIATSAGIWIQLLDVKEMYQRARVINEAEQITNPNNESNSPPPQAWNWDPLGYRYVEDPEAAAITVVYVHGWRLKYYDSINWADTSYKRLWHQGFKGKFYAFRWPTFSGDNNGLPYGYDEWIETAEFPNDTHFPPGATTYNSSEYRAWICGPTLANFVNQLDNPDNRNLFAHSMGNVIAGAALRSGMEIINYAMCNAAMSAMAYDPTITHPDCLSYETPDTTLDPAISEGYGLANKFNLKGMPEGLKMPRIFNFGLPNDDALGTWSANNKYFKPDVKYDYLASWQFLTNPLAYQQDYFSSIREVTDLSEAMGFVTQSRSRTAGADLRTTGSINKGFEDMTKWFNTTHSAQWRWSNQSTYPFWARLMEVLELK